MEPPSFLALLNMLKKADQLAGEGNDVILTGQAPVCLYLKVAHPPQGYVVL
jgi:hypothetical protein